MGDENSLAGTTKAHKHSAVSSDGGFLETTVTGVTNLSSGSIVYGDASEIVTELPAGNLNDQLVINGTGNPSWVSPSVVSSTWTTLYDSGKLGVAGSLDSGVFAAHDVIAIYIFAALSAADGQAIKFNNDSTANQYCFRDLRDGTMFTTSNYACIQYGFVTSTNWINSVWNITQRTATEKMINGFITEQRGTASTDHPSQDLMSAMWRNTADQITRVTLTSSTGATVNMQAGSQMLILGAS